MNVTSQPKKILVYEMSHKMFAKPQKYYHWLNLSE